MRTKLAAMLVIAAALSAGCGSTKNLFTPGWVVANNTVYSLSVYQDGKYLTNLPPGFPLRVPYNWREYSLVSVFATNEAGLLGTRSYTFSEFSVHVAQVDWLSRPGGAQ